MSDREDSTDEDDRIGESDRTGERNRTGESDRHDPTDREERHDPADRDDHEPTDKSDRRPTGHESDDPDRRDEALSNEEISERNEEEPERDEKVAGTDERVSEGGHGGDPARHEDDDGGISSGVAVLVAALVALVVTALTYWWATVWAGGPNVFFEELYRVAPTVEGGGVGADWVAGNTVPWLDALIAIVHAADVLMGVMILGMVFLHWAIFRRLADRMQPPVRRRTRETVATDGGAAEKADGGADDARGGDRP